MLTLLLSTDWIAGRDRILQLLAEDVAAQKERRVLIVPELISHDTERRLCAAAGDTCSRFAEVLPFTRLADRVSDAKGLAAQECLDNGGRIVAMAAAARRLHSKLKAYAAMETRPEFLISLVDAVDEFKRCCITSADLMAASRRSNGSLAQKLEELALILETYDALCSHGKRDPRDKMQWVLEALEDSDFGESHTFYVDGFPDFSRQHMEILFHLIRVAPNVTVSLVCDKPGSKAMAFENAGETAAELIRFAKAAGISYELCTVEPRRDALSPMRENLLQGSIVPVSSDHLKVYRTDTIHLECAAAVEEIFRYVLSGSRYRDISVVCAAPEAYRDTLEMLFHRSGIPVYISGTEDILEKTVVTTVLAAMDAALGGFDQQDVLRYFKSALSPLDIESCDRLEDYAIMWSITGSRWLKDWTAHPDGLGEKEDAAQRLDVLNENRRRGIEPLVRLQKNFRNAEKVRDQVRALYDFFVDIQLCERLSALADIMDEKGNNRDAQILDQLWNILLTALEQLYDVLGETVWDAESFTRLFKLLLSQYDVGTIPHTLDAVTVGSVSAMRCQQCKHLLVLGAEEGALPAYGGSGGVLSDQERLTLRQMGVPLAGGSLEVLQSEFAEIYGVFCSAEETVCVSSSGGQSAVIFKRLADMAGEEAAASCSLGSALGDPVEASALLVRFGDTDAAERLDLKKPYEDVVGKTRHDLGSVLPENVKKLYGTRLNLSATQIDTQAQCRMSYFLRYGLRAKERKAITVDPAEFGTYVHAVLEETVRDVMALGGFRKVTVEETLKIAKDHSEAYAKERFADLDSERLSYLFERNGYELELIVTELWEEMQESLFEPVGIEVNFDEGADVPAVDVSGKLMEARLRGKVDRVDSWNDGARQYFRVMDYKTGKKDFDYTDLYSGYGLQMLLYMFALEQGGERLLSGDPISAGVQYFPARVPLVSADGKLTEEEAAKERVSLWKRKGLILSQEQVLQAMEHTDPPVRMPYKRKKDGSLSGNLADSAQLALLKTYIFALVAGMVDEIAAGNVKPNPYRRGKSHDACRYCPFASVCHKQDVTEVRDYEAISAEEFWEEIERKVKKNG